MGYNKIVKPKFNGSPKQWAQKYDRRCFGLGNYPPGWSLQGGREGDIEYTLGALALHHFGFAIERPAAEVLSRGLDVAVNYFTGDWWKEDERSTRVMDKTKKRRGLIWCKPFSQGLLLALLSKRSKAVASISDWVEEDIVPDDCEESFTKELGEVYKVIASSLRSAPFAHIDKLEKRVTKGRCVRSKLLLNAWTAARDHHEADYRSGIEESLEYFKRKHGSGPIPRFWIATHTSVVILAAQRLGMKPPSLPIELEAVVMTPESIS